MSGILVVAEWVDGQLGAVAAEFVSAAVAMGEKVTLGVATQDIDSVASQGAISGVDAIVAVRLDAENFDHELQQAAVRAMIEDVQPRLVLMGFTIRGSAYAAALAEALDFGFASDAVGIGRGDRGELLVERPVYGGKIHAELEFPVDSSAIVMLRPDLWPAAEAGGAPEVRELAFSAPGVSRVQHAAYHRPSQDIDLTNADIIFSVGRGVGDPENIKLFAQITEELNVALGSSRPVVDAGWLPAAHQVGQTGVTVKPKLYVAFGISGALHHLAGMKSSSTIVAVNTDPDAAIFEMADYGAVADIHEVAEQIQALV